MFEVGAKSRATRMCQRLIFLMALLGHFLRGDAQGADFSDWHAKPDPAPTLVEDTTSKEKGETSSKPKKTFTKNIEFPFAADVRARVIVSNSNPAMVALGDAWRGGDTLFVFDLQTREKIGKVTGASSWASKSALSADGKYFASTVDRGRGGIGVWDTKKAKGLGVLPWNDHWGPKVLAFAGRDRLVAIDDDKRLYSWSLPSGDPLQTIELADQPKEDSVSFSPGGRYVAYYADDHGRRVDLIDLTNGGTAGSISLIESGCDALVFSPDGSGLAGLFGSFGNTRLMAWKVADGSVVVDKELDADAMFFGRHVESPKLQWFPSRRRWLAYSRYMLEFTAGGPVFILPEVQTFSPSPRIVINDNQLVETVRFGGRSILLGSEIPQAEVEEAIKVVRAGGKSADIGLPLPTEPNWDSMQTVTDSTGTSWKYQPASTVPQALLPKPISLKVPSRPPKTFASSDSAADKLLVAFGKFDRFDSWNEASATIKNPGLILATYSLSQGGKSLSTIPLAYDGDLLDLSADGSLALVRPANRPGRVDAYSISENKHLCGWFPSPKSKESEGRFGRHFGQKADALAIDAQHVLTVHDQQAVLWHVPDCKAVYRILDVRQAVADGERKRLAVTTSQGVMLADALTGEIQGRIAEIQGGEKIGISPGGDQLAAITSGISSFVRVFNLTDGTLTSAFYVPGAHGAPYWLDHDHLLLSGSALVDIPHKVLAWNYHLDRTVKSATVGRDGRFWILGGDQAGALAKSYVLPDASAQRKIDDTEYVPKVVLGPGDKVAMQVNVSIAGVATDEVIQSLTKQFEGYRIQVEPSAPVVMQINVQQENTGKTERYVPISRPFANSNDVQELSKVRIKYEQSFLSNGQKVWESKSDYEIQAGMIVHLQSGESLQQNYEKGQDTRAAAWLQTLQAPAMLFEQSAYDALGTSAISINGVNPAAKAPLPQ